jgi:hypothetical protein
MPLDQGNTWEYVVRLDGDENAETLEVVREAPVGDQQGWLLRGVMGESRLAWDGDTLVAAELAGTQYDPPLPLLAPKAADWKGTVTTATAKNGGTARLERSREVLDIAGHRYDCAKTVLTLRCDGEVVQLTTWFFEGMGILRQEQRRGPALTRDRYIEFVEGP